MKNTIIIIFLIFLISMSSCSKRSDSGIDDYGFFAWMDAYIAVEKDTENSVAITLFYSEQPFKKEDVVSITFADIDNKVSISSFNIDDSSINSGDYSTYIFTLEYLPEVMGICETSGVIISLANNKTIDYPVGNWTFDVNERSEDRVDAWNSPVASTNGDEFLYDYSVKDGIITKIYYGNDIYISSNKGIQNNGTINIEDSYSSPIVYIRSKINVYLDGMNEIDYGKGCYCGALGYSEDGLNASKKQNKVSIK